MRRPAAVVMLGVLVSGLVGSAPATALVASQASHVCGPAVDPCVITQTVEVVSGSTLDFGTRAVEVRGSGVIDVGRGTGRIRAGRLSTAGSGTALRVAKNAQGGLLTIETSRRCSLNTSVLCLSHVTCAGVGAGQCSVGSGAVVLESRTNGNAEVPGFVVIRAAGDVTVSQKIQMNGTTLASDGGGIDIQASGSLFVNSSLEANSGGQGTGGEIVLTAGGDLRVGATVDALGGDFDGGSIELNAGRDVLITAGISSSASSGEGYGGTLDVTAGRNIEAVGGTNLNNLALSTEGRTGYDGATAYAGDGGPQTYSAGGNISFSQYVKLRANGALPDGSGDEISIYAEGPIVLRGTIESRSKGTLGAGGLIDVSTGDSLTIASTATLDVAGSQSGGGEVFLSARGDVTVGGKIEVMASNGGLGGYADVAAEKKLTVSGTVHNGGTTLGGVVGRLNFNGCKIDVTGTAVINNQAAAGRNSFFVGDLLRILSGAKVTAPSNGRNVVQRKVSSVTPQILGTVTPAPMSSVNAGLPGCPLCGNAAVNLGETCDDGNLLGGDGCNANCQLESCVAATPGYPTVPLCDDGNPCTVDRCDPKTGGCIHITSCDDGLGCTIDECVNGVCVHTPTSELCDDNNPCTTQACIASFGCSMAAISGPCDDEVFCNGTDACLGGACGWHSGDPCVGFPECLNVCDEGMDVCRAPFGHPCSTDGNPCTDDVCSGNGGCLHIPNAAPCDDGVFCNGPDYCVGGSCLFSTGNPCDPASDCAHTCDEPARQCTARAGDPCADDGNPCTDDYCDGSGGCAHVANTAPCDDGDMCTVTDRCAAGECVATDRVPFSGLRLSASNKLGEPNDRLAVKGVAKLVDLSQSPMAGGVTLSLRDDAGTEVLLAHLPASAIVDMGGRGTTFRFRDTKGEHPSAGGVISATLKHVTNLGEARINLKARDVDLPSFVGIERLAVSLLIGADPVAGNCVSERSLPCKGSASKLRCRN